MSLSKFIKFLNELKAFDNKSYNVIHHFNVVKYLPLMITIQNFWGNVYTYIYIRLKIKPNSVKIRSLS
jgi:hypothetical protein